ncbi:MAG: cell division protein ZapA [Clostridiales bacterium]|nr:cell division protein ZapA [Clostridiales bacterium]
MKTRNDVEVIIDGKRYNLCGYESEEYLQRVASYINSKVAELKGLEGYKYLDVDMKNVLLNINLADDYFKTKDMAGELGKEKEAQDSEIFNLKHDIIEFQKQLGTIKETYKVKMTEVNQMVNAERAKVSEEQKKSIRLETENEALKKQIESLTAEKAKLTEEFEAYKKRIGRR